MVGDNAFALSDARKNCPDKDYEKIIVRGSVEIIISYSQSFVRVYCQ
jgi:hypothetical protein